MQKKILFRRVRQSLGAGGRSALTGRRRRVLVGGAEAGRSKINKIDWNSNKNLLKMKAYTMDSILSSILFGILGGFVRALVGIAKYFEKNKQGFEI